MVRLLVGDRMAEVEQNRQKTRERVMKIETGPVWRVYPVNGFAPSTTSFFLVFQIFASFLFISCNCCCWKGWTGGLFLPKCVCLSTPQRLAEGYGPFNIVRVIFWTLVYLYIDFPWYHLNIPTPTHTLRVKCCTQIVIFSLTAEMVPNLIWNRNWAEGNGHSTVII